MRPTDVTRPTDKIVLVYRIFDCKKIGLRNSFIKFKNERVLNIKSSWIYTSNSKPF